MISHCEFMGTELLLLPGDLRYVKAFSWAWDEMAKFEHLKFCCPGIVDTGPCVGVSQSNASMAMKAVNEEGTTGLSHAQSALVLLTGEWRLRLRPAMGPTSGLASTPEADEELGRMPVCRKEITSTNAEDDKITMMCGLGITAYVFYLQHFGELLGRRRHVGGTFVADETDPVPFDHAHEAVPEGAR